MVLTYLGGSHLFQATLSPQRRSHGHKTKTVADTSYRTNCYLQDPSTSCHILPPHQQDQGQNHPGPMPFTISQSNTDTTDTADHDWQQHWCLCGRAAERRSLRARQALAVFPQHSGSQPLASSKPPWMTVEVSRWEPPLPTAGNLPTVISCSFLLVAQA